MHRQPDLGGAFAAHATGHLHSFEHARGISRGADRAGLADVVRAVRLGAAGEVVALDRALEALADADPCDLDLVAGLEDLDRDGVAGGELAGAAELDQVPVCGGTRPAEVAELALAELAIGDRLEGELNGLVTVRAGRLHLHNGAGTGLDHGHGRDDSALRIEELGHPELLADYPFHVRFLRSLKLYLDVDARGQVKSHQRVDRLRGR